MRGEAILKKPMSPRVLSFFLLCFAPWLAAAQATDVFAGLEEAIAELSKITGLAPLRKVETGLIDRAGLKQYLEERIREEVKPEELRIEEMALKRFGLVPADFDLKQTTVDLLTEQAAAFYDFRKKKLFVLQNDLKLPVPEGMQGAAQSMVVLHELAHALADQHFNLEKYIKRGRSDDSSLARMAVMEGQATWLMMEVMARKMGQSLRKVPVMVEMMSSGARQSMMEQYPVLAKAPLYIQASLLFPYTGGMKFQHAVIEKSGNDGFSQVFRQAPSSTQQVLHPERYFSKLEPVKVKLPELAAPKDWTLLTEGSVGEFDHSVLLEQYLSKVEAVELAPLWRGGQMALVEHRKGRQVVLLYASEWRDAPAARRMFDGYRKVLAGKWKQMKVATENGNLITGSSEDGLFQLWLDGTRVVSIEGARSAAEFPPVRPGK